MILVTDGQALVRDDNDNTGLVFVSPADAPDGVRFLLGVDADQTAYFGVLAAPGDQPGTRKAGQRRCNDLRRSDHNSVAVSAA